VHILLFITTLLFAFIFYIFWRFVIRALQSLFEDCCETIAKKFATEAASNDDFYECIDFRSLSNEYFTCITNRKLFTKMKNEGSGHDIKTLPEEELDKYLKIL